MHLVGAALRPLMAEMGEVEGDRVVPGVAEGERLAAAVLVAADEDVVGLGQSRAAHERIDAVEIAAARSATPIMESLGEGRFRADQRRLVGRPPKGSLRGVCLARPHRKSRPVNQSTVSEMG